MSENNRKEENINVKLGGMALYGTTSNKTIGGYETSGDIENAGKIDKGFKNLMKTMHNLKHR